MKDMLKERLILLATAQEYMAEVTDKMNQWNDSQTNTERCAFESINRSDQVLNMSKEGNRLMVLLQECCNDISTGTSAEKFLKMTALLEETRNLFQTITATSYEVNDLSHKIEGEIAFQKEIGDAIQKSLGNVAENLDAAVACTEIIMADLM